IVDTAFRVAPPTSRLDAVEIGTTAWSSRLVEASDPAEASTPTTVNSTLLIVTMRPTASGEPNNWVAVSEPSTVTAALSATSAVLMKRPSDRLRARTSSHEESVPTTDVVQFADPAVNACELDLIGATAAMSGAATGDANASASSVVSVDAVPNPPRTPAVVVELPGVTISRLLPRELIRAPTSCWLPRPRPTVSTTAAMPIRMPSMVSPERSRCPRMASQPVRMVSHQVIRSPPERHRCPRGPRLRGPRPRPHWSHRSHGARPTGSCRPGPG